MSETHRQANSTLASLRRIHVGVNDSGTSKGTEMSSVAFRRASLALVAAAISIVAPAQTPLTLTPEAREVVRLRADTSAAYESGDYVRAERSAHQVVELVRQATGEFSSELASALGWHALILAALGRSAEAEPLFRRALALDIEVLGDKHPETIASVNNLAFNLNALGRSAEAEPLYRRALALRTEVLGEKHPSTIISVNNLASNLNALGRSAEAEPLFRCALALDTEVLGEKHPNTIAGINNLAANLNALGRSAEAEPLYRRALALRTEVLGEKHPDTIRSVNNLASSLDSLGRPSEAEPLYRTALALRTEVLGEKHPDTFTSLNNLAFNLDVLGRSAEAEALHRRALTLRTEVLGEKHPETIISVNNLASNLRALGRQAEAEPLFRRALALHTEVLGEKHPDTITSLNNLASNLDAQGRPTEAEPLYRRALALNSKVLGDSHPNTITSVNNLASNLNAQGRPIEAEPLYRRALALNTKVLGDSHPNTITSLNNLAGNLDALARSVESEPLYRRALALRTQVLGEKHPDSITSASNLALNLYSLGRSADAEPLFRRALALDTEVLGNKHPDTINSVGNLASHLDALGRSAEAEPLHRQAHALRTEVLGEKHPDTLTGLHNLAMSLDALGRSAEAEPLLRRALTLRTQVLGEKHPNTINSIAVLGHALLKQPARSDEARLYALRAATLIRARSVEFGAAERDTAQREREVKSSVPYMTTLADADWSAAQARPADLPSLRAEAFGALQDATAGSVTQAVALTAARRAAEAAGGTVGALARERQTLSDRWRGNDMAQTAALADGAAAAGRLVTLRNEQTAIEKAIAAADTRLRNEAPAYFALIRPAALSLADAQRLLSPDEAVLMVVPTEFGTHVMALTNNELAWTRTTMTAPDVVKAVATLRQDLDPQGNGPGHSGYDRVTAYTLYRATVEPVIAKLAGKTHVYIAADGALASLPFSALVASPPKGDDADPEALRATDWLADRFALVQLPSLQSLAFLRQFRARPTEGGKTDGFIGFGDPSLSGRSQPKDVTALLGVGATATRGGVADVSKLSELAPLPGTAVELDALRRAMGADGASVHTQGSATEAAVRAADMSHTRVVAFATHGLMAGEGGFAEPGLVLTPPKVVNTETGDDGLLTASEVTALRLDADWVILSACNTASGAGGAEPGLSGLARAFFYAGARSLLASHWRVRDDVAPMLVVEAVRIQRNNPGVSRAQALQRAARAVREDSADPTLAHPRSWAPFSLVGDKG